MRPASTRTATVRPGLSLGLVVVAWLAFLTPMSTLRLAAQEAGAGSLAVKVHWTRDSTVSPAVSLCSASGAVGGYALVHIAFHAPDGLYSATLRELRIREDAGHYSDFVTGDVNLIGNGYGPHVECGDPDPNQPGAPRMLYYDQMWPTTAGHNGPHTLTAVLEYTVFTGYDPNTGQYQTQTSTVSQTITVDVQNLVITSTTPANPEPIRWDPETMTFVPLTATVEACYRADHPVRLTIYDSGQTVVKVIEGTARVGVGATTISLTWDGRTEYDPYYGGTAPKGIYLFQWEFGGQDYYQDYDTDKSPWLSVEPHSIYGHTFVVDSINPTTFDAITHTDFRVTEASNTPPSEVTTDVYDPDLTILTSTPGALALGDQTVQYPPLQMNTAGAYTSLKTLKDNRAEYHKAHQKRYALQNGTVLNLVPATCFGYTETGSSARGDAPVNTTEDQRIAWNKLRNLTPPGQYGEAIFRQGKRGGIIIDGSKVVGMQAMTTAAVFKWDNHANAVLMRFPDGDLTIAEIDAWPAAELEQLRLAELGGCNTALKFNGARCIAEAVQGRGADVVVGYQDTIETGHSRHKWNEFLYGYLSQGKAVRPSLEWAKERLEEAIGRAASLRSGFKSATFFGNGAVTIVPPRYGE